MRFIHWISCREKRTDGADKDARVKIFPALDLIGVALTSTSTAVELDKFIKMSLIHSDELNLQSGSGGGGGGGAGNEDFS